MYGGVMLNWFIFFQLMMLEKVQCSLFEKQVIVSVVVVLVKVGDVIVFDVGIIMIELVWQIIYLLLWVIISDLYIVLFLLEFKQIEVMIIGGCIDDSSQLCIGDYGCCLLQIIWFDFVFVSCNGWDFEKGIIVLMEEKVVLKCDLMVNVWWCILLVDSFKYGVWLLFNIVLLVLLIDIVIDVYLLDKICEVLEIFFLQLIIVD